MSALTELDLRLSNSLLDPRVADSVKEKIRDLMCEAYLTGYRQHIADEITVTHHVNPEIVSSLTSFKAFLEKMEQP